MVNLNEMTNFQNDPNDQKYQNDHRVQNDQKAKGQNDKKVQFDQFCPFCKIVFHWSILVHPVLRCKNDVWLQGSRESLDKWFPFLHTSFAESCWAVNSNLSSNGARLLLKKCTAEAVSLLLKAAAPCLTHYSKSQIFVQKFWQNPKIFTSFSPKFFFDNFSREIKIVNS